MTPKKAKSRGSVEPVQEMNSVSRTDLSVATLKRAIMDNLYYVQGRAPKVATLNDWYMSVAQTVRDRVLHRCIRTVDTYLNTKAKSVSYLSAEFLMGPFMGNYLLSLDAMENMRKATAELGLDLDEILQHEEEPGLGNGGLGRLAACYLDSMATQEFLGVGYGIRYEFGIFDQVFRDGWQVEITDKWLHLGNPWELARPELRFEVQFGGHTVHCHEEDGRLRVHWDPDQVVHGVAHDMPILGYRVGTVNLLRLWKAEACESFDFQAFNLGDYYRAVEAKMSSENITKVLYPNDEQPQGKELRLKQQFFFVSCSLQDMIRVHLLRGHPLTNFHEQFAVQLNDTHPAVAVAELMRLFVDVHEMGWDEAWAITQQTFGYTNHTLMPEALERWPLPLFGRILPRHLEIIYEINRRFLLEVRKRYPRDNDKVQRLSLIEESGERYVRMAHLACVGSHAVNGVAALHSELIKQSVLKDFAELWPEKFTNVTNGVTPRRFMVLSNPELANLVTEKIGEGWITRLDELRGLEEFAGDAEFQARWREVKRRKKQRLAAMIHQRTGVCVDPDALFDIQVKRIHEYKRQHLNALHIIALYLELKENPDLDIVPRTFLFGGKAAPGYFMAKLMIKLINSIAEVVNNDSDVKDRLKVVFFPDYNVKNSQHIVPAADLSEQISTAGKEASGTGNMKFAMNGALTIGTLDGANIEIRQEVGAENFFLFGLNADEVQEKKENGYNPRTYYEDNPRLRSVVDAIRTGLFSHGDYGLFQPLIGDLMSHDNYLLFADFQSYLDCHSAVEETWRQPDRWTQMSILNTARMGKFSSDRAIRDYCANIWNVRAVPVPMDDSGPK